VRRLLYIIIFGLGIFLPGCGNITTLAYIVPDHYQGFLAIYYECPGGKPVDQSDGRAHITFDAHGVACIKESYVTLFPGGARHVASVQTVSGQSVRFAGGWEQVSTGYALLDLSVQQGYGPNGNNPPQYTISILWVGEMQRLNELSQTNQYSTELATFLEQSLGIPPNGGPPRKRP